MTEDFKFHYTYTATGELSGESFVRQTEDGIAGIGKYAKKAIDVAAQARDLSTEALERARKAESNASNSIEIAKQAMTNVETCTTTLDKWRPIVNNANDISHQAISIARSSNEAISKAVEMANHSETRSINAERAALDAQAKAEQSSVSSEKSSEAARLALDALNDAKAKIDASAHAAEAAGVKCVRYVGQSLSKVEKQVARVNIEAVRGTPEGAFIPAVRSPETTGTAGQIRFNANTNKFEGYDGAKWSGIGEKGEKGAKGDQGPVGPKGPMGERGPKGDSADAKLLVWENIQNKPAVFGTTYTGDIPWSQITGKPSIPDARGLVKSKGERGALAGYEIRHTESESKSNYKITKNSPDTMSLVCRGGTYINFVPAQENECAVKVISLLALESNSSVKITNARWAGGSPPEWGAKQGDKLIVIAHFIGQEVILGVFDNYNLSGS